MQESNDLMTHLNYIRPQYSKESQNFLGNLISSYTGLTYQNVENRSFYIDNKNHRIRMVRLTDDQASSLFPNVVPLKQDYLYLMRLAAKSGHIYASLSRTYTALRYAFGESSTFFDSEKTSFCFPFLVSVEKEEPYHYLLMLRDWKGGVEPKFARLRRSDDGVENPRHVFDPFPDFSMDEMNYVSEYLSGFLESVFIIINKFYDEPFMKRVSSSLVLYGFQDGAFFDEGLETPEEYEEMYRHRIGRMRGKG